MGACDTDHATCSAHINLQPQADGELAHMTQMVTNALVQLDTQQNAAHPNQHGTTLRSSRWMADWI